MARLPVALMVLAAALLAPALADAKTLSSFKVCGASGCKEVKDAAVLRGVIRALESRNEPVHVPTPAPTRFLRLEFWLKGENSDTTPFTQYYVPSHRAVAFETEAGTLTWVRAGLLRGIVQRIGGSVTPYARPKITGVSVDGKPVLDPVSYSRLYAVKATNYTVPDDPDWVRISVETGQPSPWSTAAAALEYSPSMNVLWRGNEFVELPGWMAAKLEAGAALRPSKVGSFPWALLFGGLGGVAVVAPTALFVRRRGSR